jgi:hypothetical protein
MKTPGVTREHAIAIAEQVLAVTKAVSGTLNGGYSPAVSEVTRIGFEAGATGALRAFLLALADAGAFTDGRNMSDRLASRERAAERAREEKAELAATKALFVFELDELCKKYRIRLLDGGYDGFSFSVSDEVGAGSALREDDI